MVKGGSDNCKTSQIRRRKRKFTGNQHTRSSKTLTISDNKTADTEPSSRKIGSTVTSLNLSGIATTTKTATRIADEGWLKHWW